MRQRRICVGLAEEGKREVDILPEVAQGEHRWAMAILDQAGSPRLEPRHHPLQDPEHVIRVQTRALARDLELRGGGGVTGRRDSERVSR